MDYQTFATRKDAKAEAAKMRGYDRITPLMLSLPNPHDLSKVINKWVIQVRWGTTELYLRSDGYVR